MARRNELTCDRCGDVIANMDRCGVQLIKEVSAKIHYWGIGQPRSYGEQRIDLCISCTEAFNRFLENKDGDNDE